MRTKTLIGSLSALLCVLCLLAPLAQASRTLLTAKALQAVIEKPKIPGEPDKPLPPPDGEIEAACGLAFSGSNLYVSDYYHGTVYAYQEPFNFPAEPFKYSSSISVGTSPEGPCQLAIGPAGALYANLWHQSALRIAPTPKTFDIASSTGIATDAAGNLYVNDRTHINVYSSAGTLQQEVGAGHLTDAYGLAVSGNEVFVADAATNEVVVFEPSADPVNPKRTIDGPGAVHFTSLKDAALAIDPTTGDLLVLDNLQPGFEHPHGAIDEFDEDGNFLFQLKDQVIDALPSGMAVDPETGILLVTSGNSENSNAFAWSAESGGSGGGSKGGEADSPSGSASSAGGFEAESKQRSSASTSAPTATTSSVIQKGGLRVSSKAALTPHKLPRTKDAPVHFSFSTEVSSTEEGSSPPKMQSIALKINRYGHLDPKALPACSMEDVQPSTTQGAMAACRASFVGEGSFQAKVQLTQQSPFPSQGKIVAFNGTYKGRAAVLAHVYGTAPVPTSFTMPFVITQLKKGEYGTQLRVSLPRFSSKWGYVTGISLNLGRKGFLSASCPAPNGFSKASFSLAQSKLTFDKHGPVSQTLAGSCGVR